MWITDEHRDLFRRVVDLARLRPSVPLSDRRTFVSQTLRHGPCLDAQLSCPGERFDEDRPVPLPRFYGRVLAGEERGLRAEIRHDETWTEVLLSWRRVSGERTEFGYGCPITVIARSVKDLSRGETLQGFVPFFREPTNEQIALLNE